MASGLPVPASFLVTWSEPTANSLVMITVAVSPTVVRVAGTGRGDQITTFGELTIWYSTRVAPPLSVSSTWHRLPSGRSVTACEVPPVSTSCCGKPGSRVPLKAQSTVTLNGPWPTASAAGPVIRLATTRSLRGYLLAISSCCQTVASAARSTVTTIALASPRWSVFAPAASVSQNRQTAPAGTPPRSKGLSGPNSAAPDRTSTLSPPAVVSRQE
ncbi:hypothetical protein GCM10020229_69960 [Kitasatospora albolonga]